MWSTRFFIVVQLRNLSSTIHILKDFKLSFHDLKKPFPTSQIIKKKLNDLVYSSYQLHHEPQQQQNSTINSNLSENDNQQSSNGSFYNKILFSSATDKIFNHGGISLNGIQLIIIFKSLFCLSEAYEKLIFFHRS